MIPRQLTQYGDRPFEVYMVDIDADKKDIPGWVVFLCLLVCLAAAFGFGAIFGWATEDILKALV